MQVKVLFTENVLTSFILKQLSFPHISVGKESACNAGDPSLIPGSGKNAGEGIGYPLQYSWASLVAQLVKESACNEGDLGSISGLGRSPGEGTGYPFQYSTLENSMDCIVHGIANCKESDVTEQLSVAKAVTYPFLTDVGIDKFTKISRQQF